jgi:hypothetical protein
LSWCRDAAALALALACGAAAAAEWSWSPTAGARLEYWTNPSLAVPEGGDATRRSIAFGLDLAARDALWDASARAAYVRNESTDTRLDEDSYGLEFGARRFFERDTLGLDVSVRHQALAGTDGTTDGLTRAGQRRNSTGVAPSWQRALGERLSLNVDAKLDSVDYDQAPGGVLVNYDFASASAALVWTLSPRTSANATASASRFRTDPFQSDSDTVSLQAGVQHLLTERWTLAAAGGPSRTKSRFAASAQFCPVEPIFCELGFVPIVTVPTQISDTLSGSVWNASAKYAAGERSTFDVGGGRSLQPSGGASLVVREQANASFTHALDDRLSLGARLRWSREVTVLATSSPQTRTKFAEASLGWRLAEPWTLEARVFWQEADTGGRGAADSSTLSLDLRYAGRMRLLRAP